MAAYARLARDAGARVIGGCCGTAPAHLAAMRGALAEAEAGSTPSIAEIEAALGPVLLVKEAPAAPPRRRRARD